MKCLIPDIWIQGNNTSIIADLTCSIWVCIETICHLNFYIKFAKAIIGQINMLLISKCKQMGRRSQYLLKYKFSYLSFYLVCKIYVFSEQMLLANGQNG